MEYLKNNWKTVSKWIAAGLLAGGIVVWVMSQTAQAADLSSGCCSDLEERIAELEATSARKGNRKVTLTVYGQVNAALLSVDSDDFEDTQITQNGTDESFVGFGGSARVSPDISAGFALELDLRQLGVAQADQLTSTKPNLRQSFVYVKSETLGKVSLGRQATATQDFDKITTANTAVAAKPLSLGALSDAYQTGVDSVGGELPFDGSYRNSVRYDTAVISGFMASASWGPSVDANEADGNGSAYDVALRYYGETAGFKVAGGVGYRHDTDLEVNVLNILNFKQPTGDVDTFLATASVMHVDTGIFVTGNYADQDADGFESLGYHLTAGVERRFGSLGKTTFYGEFGRLDYENDAEIDVLGLGVVQAIDSAATDLYLGYRSYEPNEGDDLQAVIGGARVKF